MPRSGLALRHGVTCLNTPGLIDAGYRGEIQVLLVNHDQEEDYTVRRGDRVAQLVIVRVEEAAFSLVAAEGLGEATRGSGGFGHTGT
jgi:dUTP pyrophosphatase